MRAALLSTILVDLFLVVGCANERFGLPQGESEESVADDDDDAVPTEPGELVDPKPLFDDLEAALVDSCGGCHGQNGPSVAHFLDVPDRYVSITTFPGIIVDPAGQSLLLTFPITGAGHPGPTLDAEPELMEDVRAWLVAEAAVLRAVDDARPRIPAFAPEEGFNVVELSPLAEDLEGAALTFVAEPLGDDGVILRDLQIHAPPAFGLSVIHPTFGVVDLYGEVEPDPVDSLADDVAYAGPARTAPIGNSPVILMGWRAGLALSVGFEVAEAIEP